MNAENIAIYKELRKEINKLPIECPPTDSQVELRLLQHLFTPEEAKIAIHLNIMPESLKRIHKRLEKNGHTITICELENTLDNLLHKGAIVGGRLFESLKGKKKHYSLAPMAIGMLECQVDRMTPEYASDFLSYFENDFHKQFYGTQTGQVRTVPLSVSLEPELHVEPYNDIRTYIKNLKDDIAVVNCICRQANDAIGEKCTYSDIRETCFMFGDAARFVMGKNIGRVISNDEALRLLGRAEEAGFILQTENNRKPYSLCCCCADCCHVIRGYKLHDRPAELFHTDYFAEVDQEKCVGCQLCEKKCGMDAITVTDKMVTINLDRCLGCGVCVSACKKEALTLRKKEASYVPPKNHHLLYVKIMIERFGWISTIKMILKALCGIKP